MQNSWCLELVDKVVFVFLLVWHSQRWWYREREISVDFACHTELEIVDIEFQHCQRQIGSKSPYSCFWSCLSGEPQFYQLICFCFCFCFSVLKKRRGALFQMSLKLCVLYLCLGFFTVHTSIFKYILRSENKNVIFHSSKHFLIQWNVYRWSGCLLIIKLFGNQKIYNLINLE